MVSDTIFVCSKCDAQFPKWTGRCLECGSWGTLKEETKYKKQDSKKEKISDYKSMPAGKVVKLGGQNNQQVKRFKTHFNEFDRVLGQGLAQGSLVLLGGDPGVGKSTLALQLAADLSESENCLYVSGEESLDQVGQRLNRLKVSSDNLGFLSETNIETILATIEQSQPKLVIIDSIQTIYSSELSSEAGTVNQVRTCAAKLLETVKRLNLTVILIGQVTKAGTLAGPKAAEHLVDTVLYLEGDKYKQYRILRAAKNRFGSTEEIGVWQMAKEGLKEVKNPAEVFLPDSFASVPGSVISAVVEGSRIFLVEVQALVNKASGYPKRTTSGFDFKRLEVLTAILGKRAGVNLNNFDVVVNLAGGFSLKEPALDLAVAAAIISAWQDKALPEKSVIFGEIGLGGEARSVLKTKERVREALKLGFKKIILPDFVGSSNNSALIKIKQLKQVVDLLK